MRGDFVIFGGLPEVMPVKIYIGELSPRAHFMRRFGHRILPQRHRVPPNRAALIGEDDQQQQDRHLNHQPLLKFQAAQKLQTHQCQTQERQVQTTLLEHIRDGDHGRSRRDQQQEHEHAEGSQRPTLAIEPGRGHHRQPAASAKIAP